MSLLDAFRAAAPKGSMTYLAASYIVVALYPFVPLTQYGVQKNMKMTIFLFSEFNRLFLARNVLYRTQWGSKFPHALSLQKRLTLAVEICLLNKESAYNKDKNVLGVVCYTVERPK